MSHGPELLRILSDGRFHSGVALGGVLGIGRAGVWKSLQVLKTRGIDIHAVPGKGYRLAAPVELLAVEAIRDALPAVTRTRLGHIEVHYELDSTNSELLRRAARLPSGSVCLAEGQRAGRGRLNRHWLSPCTRNLYLSLLWRFASGPDSLGGLGLITGLAVLRTLEQLGVNGAGVKWPNDIVWRGAKLAGCLIELSGESGGASCAVLGIGINVDMPRLAAQEIDQPWTDFATARGSKVSRNRLAAQVLHQLSEMLVRFEAAGLPSFLDEWRQCDVLYGRQVSVRTFTGEERGRARGVDAGGALLIEDGGLIKRYLAGDVSVRINDSGPLIP